MAFFSRLPAMNLFSPIIILTAAILFVIPSAVSGQSGKPEGLYYKSWALVVGIEDYLVAPKLEGAVAAAKGMTAALRRLGFDEVVELYNKDASFKRLNTVFNDYLPR